MQYLAERPGQLVTKDDLLDAVWPQTNVSDAVLKVCIREIREALDDNPASPKYIETAHRRGYRFIARIRDKLDSAASRIATEPQDDAIRPALVGRQRELERLQNGFEKAIAGDRRIVFIVGEPGIGKTALVDSFLKAVNGRALIAHGQCSEQYGASEPYMPVLEALSRLCRGPGREHLVELLARQAPTWLAQMPWLVDTARREALQKETFGATRERMLREIAEAVETLGPLVLVLEDLHWSDYSTLDLISVVARRREPARLMLIGTYRPAEIVSTGHPLKAVKQELQTHNRCEELPLEFLSLKAVNQYLAARFPGNLFPDDLAHLIHRRTDGNPLFMMSLLDYFIACGLVAFTDDQWRLTEGLDRAEIGMPDNILQMIEKQIDGLSEPERRVLEAASIAGAEFSTLAVANALGADHFETEETCESLARRHRFIRFAGSSETDAGEVAARYDFIHALYQNALYDRVPVTRRAHLHKKIGEHAEVAFGNRVGEIAAELAMHFEHARDYRRAVDYLQQAAENAKRRFANQETVELSRRGLELVGKLPDTPERGRQELFLQLSLAVALGSAHGYGRAEVEAVYNRARELCRQSADNLHLAPVLWGLHKFYLIRSDIKAAGELAGQLLDLARSSQDPSVSVVAHLAAGVAFVNAGEFVSAREHLLDHLVPYTEEQEYKLVSLYGQDPQVACRCFGAWALWSLGYPDSALDEAREALRLAEQLRHPETLCFALFFTAWVHQLRRESEKTLRYSEAVIELAERNGIAQWIAFGASLHGWALAAEGRILEGIQRMREALVAYRAIGSEISRPHFLGLLAEALMKSGDIDQAAEALAEALAAADSTGQRYYEAELYRLKGELLLVGATQTAEAEQSFRRAIEIARRQNAKSFELRAATSLSRLLKERERREEARSALAEVCGRFTEGSDAPDLNEARALLLELNEPG